MEKVLIAVGGNALYDKALGNNLCESMVQDVCNRIAEVVAQGFLPVVTFGNGPQVGNLLDMAETSARMFEKPITLDACVAWTQGEIGYRMAEELTRQLAIRGLQQTVLAVNTTVEVNEADPAFQKPSKPVGRFISMEEAQKLYQQRGWVIGPDANRGYRRLVPSPKPLRILEAEAIGALIQSGYITLCCGGGGIPVRRVDNHYEGIEAVIDKDFTSCLLAKTLQIEHVVICTEVDHVYLNFGKPDQVALKQISVEEADRYMADGHFSDGSMKPKIAALIDFIRHGGKRAMITSLEKLNEAMAGQAGTAIYAGEPLVAS